MNKIKLYIQLARPFTLLSPAVGFIGGGLMAWSHLKTNAPVPAGIWTGAIAAMLLNAYSNALNQIYDIGIDRINRPERPLPSGRVTIPQVWAFTVICLAASLGIAASVNLRLPLYFAAAAVATWAYSAPPLRTKARGLLANVTIAISRGELLFVSGWAAVASTATPAPWSAGFILALYVFGAASTKDFSDVEGDKAFGVVTLPAKYGPLPAAKVIAPFLILPFLLAPVFAAAGLLDRSAMPLAALSVYGAAIAALLVKEQGAPSGKQSRASWGHMYILLILAQAGFAACDIFAK